MKFKFLSLLVVLALLMGLGFVKPVQAAGYGTSFLTSITYMNVGTADAGISVDFYQEGASAITKSYPVTSLKPGAAASLGVGAVFTTSFKGSAVMSSDQPLVATMVQVPASTSTVKNRPLSNGFSAGSTNVLIPTVLKGVFNTNTIFTVQNAGSATASVTVQFIAASAGNNYTHTIANLAPGAAQYIDMGVFTQAGATFNGSVRITSLQPMVATSMELLTSKDAVYAFEGIGSGAANTVYMPSAQCAFGSTAVSSSFAIQNTSSSASTSVSVTYVGTANGTAVNKTINLGNLGPGAKVSSSGCGVTGNTIPVGFLGAATINAPGAPVVAVAKLFNSGNFVTAHNGASSGASRLAAPYVRWSNQFYLYSNPAPVQRANIAVQNIGTTAIAAGTIKVNFIGADGSVKGTYTYPNALAVGAKFSVNPVSAGLTEFGYVADPGTGRPKSYGGGAQILGPAGSQLAAVVRISTSVASGDVAEDYNALPMP